MEEKRVHLTLWHTLKGHADSAHIRSTAWSPDGKKLAFGSFNGMVCLWNAEEKVLLHTLTKHEGFPVSSVGWSPNGRQLASSSYDGTVRLWDVAMGKLQLTIDHECQVYSVAWSPDGGSLASLSGEGFWGTCLMGGRGQGFFGACTRVVGSETPVPTRYLPPKGL